MEMNPGKARRQPAAAARICRRGAAALKRLIKAGMEDDAAQGEAISWLLLSLHEGDLFDLGLLRPLALERQDDCLAVLALYLLGERPLVEYLPGGEGTLRQLEKRWWITFAPERAS